MGYFHYTVPMEHMGQSGAWTLKLEYGGSAPEQIKCTDCNGAGHYTGFRAMFDDQEEKCKTCFGYRMIRNPTWIEPTPPQELVDQLSKVMREAWNKSQNKEFKLI